MKNQDTMDSEGLIVPSRTDSTGKDLRNPFIYTAADAKYVQNTTSKHNS